jgi:hypothetical protein
MLSSGSRMRRRLRSMLCLSLTLATALSILFASIAQAQAPLVSTAVQQGPHGRGIDWTHPVRLQSVHTRSGRGTDLPANTLPFYTPPKAGLAVLPQVNWPSNCYDNYGYYVWVQGRDSWTRTVVGCGSQVGRVPGLNIGIHLHRPIVCPCARLRFGGERH